MSESTPKVRRALILSGGGGRGAYQVGVWRRLQEIGWQPDLICGTSIGSFNGALICSGWDADQMEELWVTLESRKIFKVSLGRRIKYVINKLLRRQQNWPALMDNESLRKTLAVSADITRIRKNKPKLVVSATNVRRGIVEYFSGKQLSVNHIVASCSIPVIFPWVEINDELYWDGGLLSNTPIFPAIEAGACEILVVMLSPSSGVEIEEPKTARGGISRMFDIITLGSSQSLVRDLAMYLGLDLRTLTDSLVQQHYMDLGELRVGVVGPQADTGLAAVLDLDPERVKARFSSGYDDAKEQLKGFFDQPRSANK